MALPHALAGDARPDGDRHARVRPDGGGHGLNGTRHGPSHPDGSALAGPRAEGVAGSRRALCLWLPTFELRLELVRSPELDRTSVALLSADGGVRRTLHQVSERAHAAGVRPGQLVSRAVALCPSLTLLEPDPTHYESAQEAMLEALSELTPVVEAAGPGRVFLGMDGLARLYGSPPKQARRALRLLFRLFPSHLVAATRAGYAPGKFGAWVAAVRAAPGEPVIVEREAELAGFLADCPASALPADPLVIQRLERLDVGTLGALTRLPELSLVAQFGPLGRDLRAWAAGTRIDPVRPRHRPRPIRASLDFPVPVGRTPPLHGAIDRLLERVLSRPSRRGRSVAALRLSGRLEGGGSWNVERVLREPTARREALSLHLRSRLELSPPPRAVEALSLELTRFGPADSQEELFARTESSSRDAGGSVLAQGEVLPSLREAVRELKLRLGYSPLYRVVEMDPWSRIPERRHALLSFDP